MEELEYSVEDIIVSIYSMEMLLKQIKERQIRSCLYYWKYKSQLTKELTIQKKKYNKYMLDGFYALARQTQSICMLFHIIKLNEYKLKKFALYKFSLNLNNSINDSSIDENTMIEFHQSILKIIHGINKMNAIFESKLNKTLCSSFYLILYHCKYNKNNELMNRNMRTVEELNSIEIENLKIIEDSKINNTFVTHNQIKVNNNLDKENISNNYELKNLNHGFFPNKQEYNNKNNFYTRKQNASFNNGCVNQSIESRKIYNKHLSENQQNNFKTCQLTNNNVEFNHYINHPLIYSLNSPMNENNANLIKNSTQNNNLNKNFVNPVLNRQIGFNSNFNSYQNIIQSPLNTNKYSVDNLFYSANSVYNKKIDLNQNVYLRRYITSEKKSPRSTDIARSILNPCINFTQDSSNLLNNITDSFKSVIMN